MTDMSTEMILRELMSDRSEKVVEVALASRSAVLTAAGECSELIYQTYCISNAFTFTGKLGQAFIHIATYSKHVNPGFNRGAELDDPDKLLVGSGKLIRHIRVNSKSELRKTPVKQLIAAAIAQGLAMAEKKGGVQPARVVVKRSSK